VNSRLVNGLVLGASLAALGLAAACGGPPDAAAPTTAPAAKPATKEEALAAFETVRSVLQNARCQNCHPGGDAPLQGDDGHVHLQNVLRGPEGKGMPGEECTTCHGPGNPPDSYGTHIPPGVETGWRMPRPDEKLVFVGVAPAALCAQVRDPVKNGGKNTEALLHHLEDPLVAWGWTPGNGRKPVPVPRPQFIAAWRTWSSAGSPCPQP